MSKVTSPTKLYIKELNLELLQPNTKTYMDKDQGGSKHVVIGKPGCFKAGTRVLMYDGDVKNVENIKQGERVMGDDSTPRVVQELCHNYDEMFEIIPNKGITITVNRQHILSLKCTGYNSHKKGEIIDITVDEYLKKSKTFQKRYKWYRTGVEFSTNKVEFHPYIIGVWLGDGTSATCEITNIDKEIVDYLQDYFTRKGYLITKKGSDKEKSITYRIRSQEGTKGKNGFLNFLRKNNLLNNKHIPHKYKINSRENRLELLAGLIDTDGYYDTKGKGFEITQKNERLVDDIIFVSRSLGFSAYKKICLKSCRNSPDPNHVDTYYRCFISGNGIEEIPSKLHRKQSLKRNQIKDNLVTGFKLKSVGYGEYYGFTLSNNHRFLLEDFSVVHNTGKSTLIASLLYAKKHIYPCGMVISGTEDSNGFYKTMFPSTFIFNKYDEEQLRSFIKRQKIAKKHLSNPWGVCILDDCTDNPGLFRKPLQQGIYKNSRHWKMWYILSLQYCMDVKPVIRTNVDGTFILREPNLKNRRSLWENYAGIIPDFSMFCDIMDQITNDYTALYIHNATKSNNLEDCLFWYKAKPIPKGFKFGCPDYWSFHYARYNPDYVEPFLS